MCSCCPLPAAGGSDYRCQRFFAGVQVRAAPRCWRPAVHGCSARVAVYVAGAAQLPPLNLRNARCPLQRNLTLCKDALVLLEDDVHNAECPESCNGMFDVSWVL